jgi:uncharacterized membrane protein
MNSKTTSQLKAEARGVLAGRWVFVTGIFLLQLVCNLILNQLVEFAFPLRLFSTISVPRILCTLLISLVALIISTGAAYIYLNLCRGISCRTLDLFYAFSHQPEHVAVWFFVIYLILNVLAIPPALLLCMCVYTKNPLWIVAAVIAALICAFLAISKLLQYAMFPYLYVDAPWKPARELLQESRSLMAGHRARYFYLQISYLGLLLLGMLTFGFGLIWIIPYISTTNAEFYLDLTGQN